MKSRGRLGSPRSQSRIWRGVFLRRQQTCQSRSADRVILSLRRCLLRVNEDTSTSTAHELSLLVCVFRIEHFYAAKTTLSFHCKLDCNIKDSSMLETLKPRYLTTCIQRFWGTSKSFGSQLDCAVKFVGRRCCGKHLRHDILVTLVCKNKSCVVMHDNLS